MKKSKTILSIISMVLACMTSFPFAACQDSADRENSSTVNTASTSIDVDLTKMSSTMVYAEVSNMVTNPKSYLGKTVKMRGSLSVYRGSSRTYYACLIADATACCSQGIEFVLKNNDYPDESQNGDTITVTGIFDTYIENGYTYCQLIDAKMK